MNQFKAALAAAAFVSSFSATAALAQEEAKEVWVYSSYFTCQAGMQADKAVEGSFKAVYDGAVKDGTIRSWGWMQHHTGGPWTRVAYHTASSQKAALMGVATLDQRSSGKDFEAANKQFNQACASHEDYLWRSVAGNDGQGARGKSALSVYYVCDSQREDEADSIIKHVFAPVFDKLVAEGKLTSWGWLEHIIGGKYRRLATMTAPDLGSLMQARGEVIQAMTDEPLGDTLDGICGSHADYIWNLQTQ